MRIDQKTTQSKAKPAFLRASVMIMAVLFAVLGAPMAFAGTGQPSPWQLNFQGSVTEVMDFIHDFHNWLMVLITLITLFVLGLLIYVMVRFRESRNPIPSKTTHHAGLEVAWTVIPVLILVAISIPSFRLLKLQLVTPTADITIKATGYAWYWGYEFSKESGGVTIEQRILSKGDQSNAIAGPNGEPRLLAVDNEVVVPVNKVVKVLVTAADVLHAFAVPSFGIKVDATPGRINETWFKANREGVYYGQCSELCGQYHAFMPIAIRVVSEKKFAAWIDEKKKLAAQDGSRSTAVADVR
jgi:cytochrome c oxidase subunit II